MNLDDFTTPILTLADVEADRVGKPLPKPRPTILVKAESRGKKLKAAEKLRANVRARDGHQCQACHIPVFVDARNPLQRAQVHHIQYRSRGGADAQKNLITVCAECHAKIHAHELEVIGSHAKDVWFRKVTRKA